MSPAVPGSAPWWSIVERLTANQQCTVVSAISCGQLSGWVPSPRSVQLLASLANGDISFEEYRAEVLATIADTSTEDS